MASTGESVCERMKGRTGRRWMLAGAVMVAVASVFAMWWLTTLSGLPDVGDPFDVEAFAEAPISENENAYTFRDPKVFSVAKAFKREPERSKRVARLVYANLLAVADLPLDR